jgi:hypothetical protein
MLCANHGLEVNPSHWLPRIHQDTATGWGKVWDVKSHLGAEKLGWWAQLIPAIA